MTYGASAGSTNLSALQMPSREVRSEQAMTSLAPSTKAQRATATNAAAGATNDLPIRSPPLHHQSGGMAVYAWGALVGRCGGLASGFVGGKVMDDRPPFGTFPTPEELYRWTLGLPPRPFWESEPWKRWFAWRPIRMDGQWVWGKWLQRRRLWSRRERFTPFGVYFPTRLEYRPLNEETAAAPREKDSG